MRFLLGFICGLVLWISGTVLFADEESVVRVFIFAGQSNMVGSDSKIADIVRFPPFVGLDQPQRAVRFSYCLGREEKLESAGWESLRPVYNVVGPELSFAREVTSRISGPIAIIKVAAGGTHLGGDWNPDQPTGFQLYPLALRRVREALGQLDSEGVKWRLEGFMWHQGENDMFEAEYMASYGKNLKNFIASWRRDLQAPELRFFIGELCTKTIWGMDLRPRMYAISLGQKEVADADPLVEYVPTSHVGVEIGGGAGLHYHYGTLGQLEHGVCYANSWLQATGRWKRESRQLVKWPYAAGSKVRLFVLAGHRNMEGERAFVQDLARLPGGALLLQPDLQTASRYSLGGGYRVSDGWEALGPSGEYETFGPELSFSATMKRGGVGALAIAKFTHSGSQIIDWTPEGSEAKGRNLYSQFLEFVRQSVQDLRERGHEVELAGICYHVGENDMSWGPFRRGAPERVLSLVRALRKDLQQPQLRWYISQQVPSDHESVNGVDVLSRMSEVLAVESGVVHLKQLDLPPQREQLVLDAAGVVRLGEQLAGSVLSDLRVGGQP